MIIVADSDGLIGISQQADAHYVASIRLLQRLEAKKAKFVYPATTIAEATAILQIRLNKPQTADQIIESVRSGYFHIEPVGQETLVAAMGFLSKERNKHVTLFDGIVAAIARKHHTDAIFSFDTFYKKHGFKLASEL